MSDDFRPGPEFRRAVDRRSRQLRRQRRFLAAGVASTTVVLAVAIPLVLSSRTTRSTVHVVTPVSTAPPATTRRTTTVPSVGSVARTVAVRLPSGDTFNQIAATPQGAIVLGGATTDTANSASPSCVIAAVDAVTLRVLTPSHVSCADPTLAGHTVGMVNHYRLGGSSGTDVDVTIASVTDGRVSEGPVVMSYSECSDCGPVTAHGAGVFWIYDNNTTRGAELLEISDTTGTLIATIPMPELFRPLLAANDNGLFIANSLEGGQAQGQAPPSALYHIAAGTRSLQILVADPTLLACWLTDDPTHLWIGMGSQKQGCTQETVWRLDGADPQPAFQTPTHGYLPPPVGDESGGLWTVEWTTKNTPGPETVALVLVHVDPNTGTETTTAILPSTQVDPYSGGMTPGTGILVNRYLYLLPSTQAGGGTLIRIDTTST